MADVKDNGVRDWLVSYFAERASPEYDEVVVQADYATRAMLSFYRFRQLGGSDRTLHEVAEAVPSDDVPLAPRRASVARKTRRFTKIGPNNLPGQGVHYVSTHPEGRMLQYSIIALMVLFESAANAYFFAQQSEFGLSGGLFQAAAVSLANVAVSFFIIGYWGLRHAATPATNWFKPSQWDRRNYYKLFGFAAVGIGLIIVLLVNLSAAHYRNLIDLKEIGFDAEALGVIQQNTVAFPRFMIDRDVCEAVLTSEIGLSIGSAATNAMCRPFALHSLDAMILFALGIAISALAAFKGRGADADYPGLSDAARHAEKAREDLMWALEDYYEAIDTLVLDARKIAIDEYFSEEDFADEGVDRLPENARGEQAGYSPLTAREEIALRRLLEMRVAFAEALLEASNDILSDEFAVEQSIVDQMRPPHRRRMKPQPGEDG